MKADTIRKALFIVPQIGFNDVELLTIRKKLERHAIKCSVASFALGTVISKTGKTIQADVVITQVKAEDYGCFIFVGGKNVASLAEYPQIIEVVKNAYQQQKILALLCINSVLLLPKANLIKNKKITVYKMKNKWSETAANEYGAVLVDEPIVIDGNIITCRDEEDAKLLADTLIEIFLKK